jgi:hypothetical protein
MQKRFARLSRYLGLLTLLGCGGNPLIATWTAAISPQTGATDKFALTLNSDKSLSMALSGTGSCSGSLSYAGMTWSSSGSTLTISGTPTCTGAGVTCPAPVGTLGCSSTGPGASSCTYAMSNNNKSLVVSGCSDSTYDATYTTP